MTRASWEISELVPIHKLSLPAKKTLHTLFNSLGAKIHSVRLGATLGRSNLGTISQSFAQNQPDLRRWMVSFGSKRQLLLGTPDDDTCRQLKLLRQHSTYFLLKFIVGFVGIAASACRFDSDHVICLFIVDIQE